MGFKEFIVKKENKKALIIGSSVVAGLLVVGIGVATFAMSNSNGNSRSKKVLKTDNRILDEMSYEEAVAQYRDAIALDPTDVDAYVGLAEVYAMMGEKEQAQAVLDEAMENVDEDDLDIIEEARNEVEELAAVATIATTAATTTEATTEATTAATTTEATTAATTTEATTEATTAQTSEETAAVTVEETEPASEPEEEQIVLPNEGLFDTKTNYEVLIDYVSADMVDEVGFSSLNRLAGQVPYNIDGGEAEPVDMTALSDSIYGVATYWFADVDADDVDEMVILYYGDAQEVTPDSMDIAALKARVVKADESDETVSIISDAALMTLSRENTSLNIYSLDTDDTTAIVLTGSVQGTFICDFNGAFTQVEGTDYELFADYEAGMAELEDAVAVASINFVWGDDVDENNDPVVAYDYKADELVDTTPISYIDSRYHDVECYYTIDDDGVVQIIINPGENGEYEALAASIDETFNSQNIHADKVSIIRADSKVFSFVIDLKYGYNYNSLTGEMYTLDTVVAGGAQAVSDYIAVNSEDAGCTCDVTDGEHSWVMSAQNFVVFHPSTDTDSEYRTYINFYEENLFLDSAFAAENNCAVDIMSNVDTASIAIDVNEDGMPEEIVVTGGYGMTVVVGPDPWTFESDELLTLVDARYVSTNGNDYIYAISENENGEFTLNVYGFEYDDENQITEPVEIIAVPFFSPSFTVAVHEEDADVVEYTPFTQAGRMLLVAPCDYIDGNVVYSCYVSGEGLPVNYSDYATPIGEYSIKAIVSSDSAAYEVADDEHNPVAVTEETEYIITGIHSTENDADSISAIVDDKEVRIAINNDKFGLVFTLGESTPVDVVEVRFVPSEEEVEEAEEVDQVPLSITFNGAEDGVYYNASSMSFSLNINTEDPSLIEDIYYVVKIGDAVVSQGAAGSIDGTLYVNEITDGLEYLPNGTYEVTFYNSAEELISVGTVEVVSEN